MKKGASKIPSAGPSGATSSGSPVRAWVDFWFTPTDPRGMHAVRVLTGLLLLAWLVPLAGELEAFFGLNGWFDRQAYYEAARLPEAARPSLGWSALFLAGTNSLLLWVTYIISLAVVVLFTLGIAARLTATLTWIIVVSFTANPAIAYDADTLLVILSFYLMIGYVLHGQSRAQSSLSARLLGGRGNWLFGGRSKRQANASSPRANASSPSVAANVAMRLLQLHLAVVMVTTGLHKLQFGDWWAGVALWYPLYPPFEATVQDARANMDHAVTFLFILSMAAYATLCWQIAFPVFAWKPAWRKLLLGGAIIGWLGNALLYELPVYGPGIFIGCLSYLSPVEWERTYQQLAKLRELVIKRSR